MKGVDAKRLSFVAVVTQESFGKGQLSFVEQFHLVRLSKSEVGQILHQFLKATLTHTTIGFQTRGTPSQRRYCCSSVLASGVGQVGVLSRVADATHGHSTSLSQGGGAWRCDQTDDVPSSSVLQFCHNHWQPRFDVMHNLADHIQTMRIDRLKRWCKRAEDLLPRTLELIEQTSDSHMRRFFK